MTAPNQSYARDERCCCGHERDDHENMDGFLLTEVCMRVPCHCSNFWPESRRAERDRRRQFLAGTAALEAGGRG